ncbi:MAG: hypothetical protein RL757_2436 [Bacteroidota bacterium]|jgi:outer membrane protein TolC
MLRLVVFLCLLFALNPKGIAQANPEAAQNVLSLTDFLELVKKNYPLSKQAALLNQVAQAELRVAKGGFDPKLFGNYEQKYFDSKNYFSFGEFGVKLPTWYGIELKSSYNTALGSFVDPENKLPKQGQAIIGLSVPVLQSLRIDDRRANLFKAQEGKGLYQAEIANLTNDIAFDATQQYWKWAYAYQQTQIFEQALQVAQARFNAIKTSFELGDRMAMDTLESFTQVQDRTLEYNNVQLEYQIAQLKIANYLASSPQTKSLQPQSSIEPPPFGRIEGGQAATVDLHPLLRGYAFKLNQLNIDSKLKADKLKPKLNLNYNFLSNGSNFNNLLTNNYKWGITFSSSALFRSERGDLALAKLKIEALQLARDQKAIELKNKQTQATNELENLQQQIRLYQNTVRNYQQLLQLENERFSLGESSFFLINSRENKYIEAQLKLAKLYAEFQIAQSAVKWSRGLLGF